jgi:hypothetical protein
MSELFPFFQYFKIYSCTLFEKFLVKFLMMCKILDIKVCSEEEKTLETEKIMAP